MIGQQGPKGRSVDDRVSQLGDALMGCILVGLALAPIRALPFDGAWLDTLLLPGRVWVVLPILMLIWSALQGVLSLRGRPRGLRRVTLALVVLVVYTLVWQANWRVNQLLLDQDTRMLAEHGAYVVLDHHPGTLRLPCPYSPPSQAADWRTAVGLCETRRLVLDLAAGSALTARCESANALISAGRGTGADGRAAWRAKDEDILASAIVAKEAYSRGDIQGSLAEMNRMETLARSYSGVDGRLAVAEVQRYRCYYDAALSASRGDTATAAAKLVTYAEWCTPVGALQSVGEDPVFERFRSTREYAAFVSEITRIVVKRRNKSAH